MSKPPPQERPKRAQPRPTEVAIFNDGKWFAWRIDGKISLFRRRSFYEKDEDGNRTTLCIDFEPLGPVDSIERPKAMPPDKWEDLKGAHRFCTQGLT